MKLTKRSNGIYTMSYIDKHGFRVRHSLGTRDKVEAERKALSILSGGTPRDAEWTLGAALEHCMDHTWSMQKSWRSKVSVVKAIQRELGCLKLTQVDYSTLNNYVTACKFEGCAPATINRRMATISKALTEAVKLGKLHGVPPIPRLEEDNIRERYLSDDEERALLAATSELGLPESVLMRQLLVFLLDTGARLSEALNLTKAQVTEESVLFMYTKSVRGKAKHRRVPLTRRASLAARYLVDTIERNEMWSQDALQKKFNRVRAASGIDGFSLHTLRHTCASRLVQRGASLQEVKEWLGHSSIVMTERYAHLADSSLTKLTALLETN